MNNLDKYVGEKRRELKRLNYTNELDIIRYIYLDLGNRFSFNNSFQLGDPYTKSFIYDHSSDLDNLNKCMETNKTICVSDAPILEYVLKRFGIDIKTIVEDNNIIAYNHAYNFIKLKDGRKFCVDLQKDIKNIQTRFYTSYFGFESYFSTNYVIAKHELEKLDLKLGYITREKRYTNEYIDLLHTVADGIDNLREKASFILENIDCVSTNHMGYTDREWHHARVLKKFFSIEEFDYEHEKGNITLRNFYKDTNGKRKYISIAVVTDEDFVDIYIYNTKVNGFRKISIENYINSLENGLTYKVKEKVY